MTRSPRAYAKPQHAARSKAREVEDYPPRLTREVEVVISGQSSVECRGFV